MHSHILLMDQVFYSNDLLSNFFIHAYMQKYNKQDILLAWELLWRLPQLTDNLT